VVAPLVTLILAMWSGCGGGDDNDSAQEAPSGDDPGAVAEAWAAAIAEGDFATACKYVASGHDFGRPGEFGSSRKQQQEECPARLAELVEYARRLPAGDLIYPSEPGIVEDVSVSGEPGHISGAADTVTLVTPSHQYVLQMEEIDGEWGVEEMPVRGAQYQH
jgi:hypothetical protein